MKIHIYSNIIVSTILLLLSTQAYSEVLLDVNPLEVSNSFLFVDHADANKYYYIAKTPKLAKWESNLPKFSFIKYTKSDKDITGGLVHFMVTYGLDKDEFSAAESELKKKYPKARLHGPVPFNKGEFHLISASSGEGGIFNRKIVGTGTAPLLAGQEAAVSLALKEEGATLLEKSFKSPTSDVSIQFLLTYSGLTPAYRAKLIIDWDKVYNHEEFSAKGSTLLTTVEINKIYDELKEKGAIKLDVIGQDENLDALLQTAYATLVQMMFDAKPVKQDDLGKESKKSDGSLISKLLGGSHFGYYKKTVKHTGKYTVDLTRRKRDTRDIPITGNIAGLYKKYGENKDIFQVVNLDDADFQKRTVHFILDGENYEDFSNYINFVSVNFTRKQAGSDFAKSITFDKASFKSDGPKQSVTYLRLGDKTDKWLNYQFSQTWSIRGGIEKKINALESSSDVITLSPPYSYRTIEITADEDNMVNNDIFRIAVQFRHKYEKSPKIKEVVLRKGQPLNQYYKYPAIENNLDYEYKIVYLMRNSQKVETDWLKGSDPFVYAFYEQK